MGFFLFPTFVLTKLSQWFRRREVEVDDTSVFNYITEGESWHSSVQLEKKNL